MKISLVFVAWNRCWSAYLGLTNIFENQKLDKYEYEFIIVDDYSIDNTREVLDYIQNKYPQFDIKIFSRTEDGDNKYTNNGVVKNFGIKQASGDVIITLDVETYMLMSNGIEVLSDWCLSDHNTLYTPQWKMMEAKSHYLYRGVVDYVLRKNIPSFSSSVGMKDYFTNEAIKLLESFDSLPLCTRIPITKLGGYRLKNWINIRGEIVNFITKANLEEYLINLPKECTFFETFQTNMIGLCHAAHKSVWDKTGGWGEGVLKYEWGGAEAELFRRLSNNGIGVKELESIWVYHINHPREEDVDKCYRGLKCELPVKEISN